jgi:hypothetical protein
VNFSASEVQEDLQALKDKLEDGITIDDLLSITNLPILSEFSQAAGGLLPVNLLKIGADGKVDLLSLTELQQALSKGLGDIKGYLEGEVLGLFNALKGEVEAVYNQAKEVYEELSNLGETLQKDNSLVFDAAISALNGATGLNINAQSLATLKKAGVDTMNNLSDLSPKQIKDLADPNFFGKLVNTTLDASIAATGVAAEILGEQSISNAQLNNSSYMDLFRSSSPEKTKTIPVYRQVYWAKGEGATPEAAAKKSSSGNHQLVDDYSLAVDNSNILLESKITFADDSKEREAVDVATKAKGLSITGPYPVVAIFFEEREKALEYRRKYPKYVNATIKTP